MKENRILSTVGVCPTNSTRLRSYCNLMQRSLHDKWLFADEFVESHVCFVRDDYLASWTQEQLDKSQVIVVINLSNAELPEYEYQITAPLSAAKIKTTLNKISEEVEFKPLNLTKKQPKKAVGRFKAAFNKIRKSFFGRKTAQQVQQKVDTKKAFIRSITQRIQPNAMPSYKVVLLGSPGSGKTTAIHAASDGKALSSEVSATDSVASAKANTTVGIDYADIILDDADDNQAIKIKLFGTPGQIKYNFVWDMVAKDANAFIILLDMSRPEPLLYLNFYLKFLKNEIGKSNNIYCALTHCETYSGSVSNMIYCIEDDFPGLAGVYRVDARNKDDLLIMIEDIYPQIKSLSQVNSLQNKLSVIN